jgi:hypothetical protein
LEVWVTGGYKQGRRGGQRMMVGQVKMEIFSIKENEVELY